MRTNTHIIDTKSIKKVITSIPDEWVIRELSERDYGTDMMIELFLPSDNLSYESSGALCNIQVKGTEKKLVKSKDGTIHYSIKKSFLKYCEKFTIPFLLFRVDVSSKNGEIYFLWLQRYIFDVLDEQQPSWRTDKTKSIILKIPFQNKLSKNIKKIVDIAFKTPYTMQLITYRELFTVIEPMMKAMANENHKTEEQSLEYLKTQLQKLLRLDVLLDLNQSCVSSQTIQSLISLVDECSTDNDFKKFQNFSSWYNMELLSSSVDFHNAVKNFVVENEGEVLY